MSHLQGKKIALLATDGFEQSELLEPKQRFEAHGATVHVVAPEKTMNPGEIRGWDRKDWGRSVKVDVKLADAKPEQYDALVLPGGVINPDKLRTETQAIRFIKAFAKSGKPVGAICHGPQMLVEAGLLKGRTMTSWPGIKTDMQNAGADWQDAEVVVDQPFIFSRKPEDIPAFSQAVGRAVAGQSALA